MSRDRIDPNEDQREPRWSENQAFMVELMQPQRSGEIATSADTILWLRKELDETRARLFPLLRMQNDVDCRVLPALAKIHDGNRCPAPWHSPYSRCPHCDLREFLERWRGGQENDRPSEERRDRE